MEVRVIASGSSGNATLIHTPNERILIDCGIGYGMVVRSAGYVDYAIITHEHCDHVLKGTLTALLENGSEVYMTRGTMDALKIKPRHNLHHFSAGEVLQVGSCEMATQLALHDAAEPIAFTLQGDERLLYATDTGKVPEFDGDFTRIFLEANYSEKQLKASAITDFQKERIKGNHLSIEAVEKWFSSRTFKDLREVYVMHVSRRHGNAIEFAERIKSIVGVKVVCG